MNNFLDRWVLNIADPCEKNPALRDHVSTIMASYQRLLGIRLLPQGLADPESATRLFYAPFVVLSHNSEADPIFNYANYKGLELFGFEWGEFIRLPSRLSAEPVHQTERDTLLAEVSSQGYIKNYQGVRITKTGQRFMIKNAVVWNLTDATGNYTGQAACFSEWQFL